MIDIKVVFYGYDVKNKLQNDVFRLKIESDIKFVFETGPIFLITISIVRDGTD